jgi:hypothetical protein
MKIIGFIKWHLNKISMWGVSFFWMISICASIFEPTEIAKYHVAIWAGGLLLLLSIIVGQAIKSSYRQYLKEQQILLNMIHDSAK